jgi:hypothetical protein
MPHRSAIIVLVIAMSAATGCGGCGDLSETDGGDADAGDAAIDAVGDSDTPCSSGPFGAPTPIAELNTAANERGFRAAPNELVAVFARLPTIDDAGVPMFTDIMLTSRSVTTGPFATPISASYMSYLQQVPDLYPSLSGDTLSLFYEGYCLGEFDNDMGTLCGETRDGGTSQFGVGETISDWVIAPGPFGAGYSIGDGFVTSDGLRYYAVGLTTQDGGGPVFVEAGTANAIFLVARPGLGTFEMFGAETPFAGPLFVPSDPSILVDNPVLSNDELTMFVSTTTTTSPVPHVQRTTRATTSDNFGPLSPSHELDSAEGEYPTWLSPDQCRLYLTRAVGGQTDIYEASRSP